MGARARRRLIPGRGRHGTGRVVAAVRWPLLAYVPVAVLVARRRRDWGLPAAVSLATAYGAPLAVAGALPRGRVRAAATWGAHMWAYKVAFAVPYDRPERLRGRLRIDEPIAADARIGLGVPPPQRLQRALRRPPRLTWLDRALTGVYVLWEAEPHAALAWILLRHPGRFPGSALRLAATFDATLLGYFARPTAPPWWASEREGRMDRAVRRVTAEVIKDVRGRPRPGTDHNSGANPWASFPSDHFASTLSTAIMLGEADPRAGVAGAAYTAALGLALVYTGEHYVIDLVWGAVLALAVHGAMSAGAGTHARASEILAAPGPLRARLRR